MYLLILTKTEKFYCVFKRGKLSRKQKQVLAHHRKTIEQLLAKAIPVERKRKILVQRGGGIAALILPVILSTVLGALGSKLFKK